MNNEEEARDKKVSDLDLEVDGWPLIELGNEQVVEICLDKDGWFGLGHSEVSPVMVNII